MLMAFVKLISSISHSIFTLICLQSSPFSLGSKLFLYLTHGKETSDARYQLHLGLDELSGGQLRLPSRSWEGRSEELAILILILGGVLGSQAPHPKRVPFAWFRQAAARSNCPPKNDYVLPIFFL